MEAGEIRKEIEVAAGEICAPPAIRPGAGIHSLVAYIFYRIRMSVSPRTPTEYG